MDVELFAGIAVVAEHRYLYVELEPEHAWHAMVTYQNGVRKLIYRDPDGNEVGVGGAPVEPGTKL